jgi:large subunit ribosomal protein L1
MAKHGKSYVAVKEKVDRNREYSPHEAVKLIKETKRAKFDESVEVHFRTGLNVRHADEQLRGTRTSRPASRTASWTSTSRSRRRT